MGFHLYITCTLEICESTGKHFYYGGLQKVYGAPPDIPEVHRKYVKMSGGLIGLYMALVTDEVSTSVENFVDKFPNWSNIVSITNFEDFSSTWNEEMHNNFYASLKWFAEQNVCYMISWTD